MQVEIWLVKLNLKVYFTYSSLLSSVQQRNSLQLQCNITYHGRQLQIMLEKCSDGDTVTYFVISLVVEEVQYPQK